MVAGGLRCLFFAAETIERALGCMRAKVLMSAILFLAVSFLRRVMWERSLRFPSLDICLACVQFPYDFLQLCLGTSRGVARLDVLPVSA